MASTASATLNCQVGVSTDKDSLTSRLEAAYQAAKRASAVHRTTPKEDFVINGDCLIRYKDHSSEVVIPDGIATIEKWAFMNNTTLSSITLPNSPREIKDTAFYGCTSLKSVMFPERLEKIGNFSFKECHGLKNVYIPRNAQLIGSVFDNSVIVNVF